MIENINTQTSKQLSCFIKQKRLCIKHQKYRAQFAWIFHTILLFVWKYDWNKKTEKNQTNFLFKSESTK